MFKLLLQIGCQLSVFVHLLGKGPPDALTFKNLSQLLKPDFSEEGSNNRMFEETVYKNFLTYLREAAGKLHYLFLCL